MFEGPLHDNGFNDSFQLGINAVQSAGDSVVTQDNLPYTVGFSRAVARQISNGARVVVETLGAGPLFNTCTASTVADVKCFTPVTTPGHVPSNTVGFWQEEWNLQYVAGVAAGLKTKSNTLGFISPFKLPVTYMAANSFTLGCRSVNPKCQVRVVVIGSYFNPAAESTAANTLINAGADVLDSYANDPTYCEVAQKRGRYAIGLYTTSFSQSCPNAVLVSTVYDVSNFFKQQAQEIRNGTWHGGQLEWIPVGTGPGSPRLSDINPKITTPALRATVEARYAQIVKGDSPFKGPIYDQKGNLRVPTGTTLSPTFLWYGWTWYVKGIIGS
jgi:basic membrane protein A